jgi:hypothetical protein
MVRILVLAVLFLLASTARAHETWISKERRTNPRTQEWCCNAFDCHPLDEDMIRVSKHGYMILGQSSRGAFIPHGEAMPSGDHRFWQCKRPDKSTRCFFYPPLAY